MSLHRPDVALAQEELMELTLREKG